MFERDLFGEFTEPEKHGSTLAETWDYPPFTVLNAREGWWQERKRQWLALGIQSELGRGGGLMGYSAQTEDIGHYRRLSTQDMALKHGNGTSEND